MLPTSSLYDYLEGRVPNPAYTFTKVAEITEAEENERINKEIGERRTRLGAKIGQVTNEVKREVLERSNLEQIYGSIIDWTNDDDQRRLYEEKVLQRAYDTLAVLPPDRKSEKRAQVVKLAEGLVILKDNFALAWNVVLEWKDVEKTEDWDASLLEEYTEIFPDDGLSKVLKAYLSSEISPFPPDPNKKQERGDEDEDDSYTMTAEDRLILMVEGNEESSRLVMSQRMMGEYFLHLGEYANAVETAKKAAELIGLEGQICGLKFQNNLDAINTTLATALVHHQSPRNHPEARSVFDGILQRKPRDTAALLGVGLILEEEEDYIGAIDFLSRALRGNPDVKVRTELAWCKALSGDFTAGLKDLEDCLPDLEESDARTKDLRSQTLYRIGMCIWNIDTSRSARKDRKGAYASFLASLKTNLNFAPAYAILGIYYADYGKDRKRARKCFQKAFELSPSETEAAERLARSFADKAEWDLVEVVAQRVIAFGKVRPPPGSKKKGLSWPFAALGVCQLNNQDYPKSIVSFQSALRIAPEDFNCWVGLGESYHNSGRYIAATRAFEQALKLQKETASDYAGDDWFARYMLANVRRELGDFDDAVAGYENVLSIKPMESGVVLALLQTHVENAWRSLELGFFGRAAESARMTIGVAKQIVGYRPDAFNLWKALGEACAVFSWVQSYLSTFPVADIHDILTTGTEPDMYEKLGDIDDVKSATLATLSSKGTDMPPLDACLLSSILAQKRGIHVCAHDIHAQAVAWYNLGWTEYRAHVCLVEHLVKPSKKRKQQYLKASVRCFKRAIELEAGNSEFWNALGIVTTTLNPKVAQHAFVRSLHLNDRSARVWTNIGALYLLQNDHQLANEAFTRAQSSDPELTHAWLGQGILALLLGQAGEAHSLFTHAFEISDASSAITKRLYASSSFDHLLSLRESQTQITDVLQPLLALHQLKSQAPGDVVFEHLSALFAERVEDYVDGLPTLESVCNNVEAEYEVSESPLSLARFAQAKADLARAQLVAGEFGMAAESANTTLDLSAEDDTGVPDPSARRKYRLSAHLTAGLACHYTGHIDQAIVMFRSALEETDGNPDAVCVLAKVLWAKGGTEERNVVREQLFDCVEKHPEHAGAILLLGVIALIDGDKETIEAVSADLQGLRTRLNIGEQQQRNIGQLLTAFTSSITDEDARDAAEIGEATTAVMLAPNQPHGWSQLADLAEDEVYPAEMALLTAIGAAPPKGSLKAEDLCRAYVGTSKLGDAQKAVMMAPWISVGWEGLV